MNDVMETIDQALRILQRKPIDGYEIYFSQSSHFDVESKDGKIETLDTSRYLGMAFRILNHQRMGFSYTTLLNPSPSARQNFFSELDRVIEDAIGSAGATSADPCFDFAPVLKTPPPQLPIFDETLERISEKTKIEKTKDWDSRFNIGHFDDAQYAIIDYEGTRYHNADLYATKISNPRIKFIEYPLQKDKDPANFRIENISNPARYSPEGIKDMQSDMWVYNCQMLLKPEDPARRQFTQAMIAYFDSIPRGCNFYLLVDPASKRKKKSDYTVMLIVAVGWVKGELKYLIVDGVRDKLNPKQRIDTGIDLAIKWGIRESGWEEVGLGDDNFYLEEKRREKQIYFTVIPVKTSQVSKEDRIRNILMPEYAQHKWLWPNKNSLVKYSLFDGKNYDLTVDMDFEMMQFPLCEHDDLLDTMTFLSKLNIIKPDEIKTVEDSQGMTFGEYSKIKDDRLKEFNRDPWNKMAVGGRV